MAVACIKGSEEAKELNSMYVRLLVHALVANVIPCLRAYA